MQSTGLFFKVHKITLYLSTHADSLMFGATSNSCESFNNIVCKEVAGKRVNYSQRGSYYGRAYAAVIRHNTLSFISTVHQQLGVETPNETLKLEANYREKLVRNAKRKAQRKEEEEEEEEDDVPPSKKQKRMGTNNNYGEKAKKPDLDVVKFEKKALTLRSILKDNRKNRLHLELETRGQSTSSLWNELMPREYKKFSP